MQWLNWRPPRQSSLTSADFVKWANNPNPKGEGGLHVEFGGMSWDNYRLGVDVLIEKNASQNMVAVNVQLCPRGTCVFCQIFGDVGRWGNGINLWHWDIEGKKEIQVAHVSLMDHIRDPLAKMSKKEI